MKSLLILLLVAIGINLHAQVAISSDGSLPDNSAMLDIKSTVKGILIPSMAAAQRDAIVSPATGLLIFCTDNNFYFSNRGTPDTPNWVIVNSQWSSSGSNIYYSGGNVGIGTSNPATIFDIAGGNNWNLTDGEGDFRLGNSQYRLKMGVALGGGGAGSVNIMQFGQPGGYNVLALGAQGNQLVFINGGTQRVGIGTNSPDATLGINGTLSVADGTQGAGKVLTSDANGLASWGYGDAHYIGESYGGGIVFYVYDNGKHGLIAATTDSNPYVQWYNGTNRYTGSTGDGLGAGSMNTAMIVATQIGDNQSGSFAAKVAADFTVTTDDGITYGDWYLPSKYELNLLYEQQTVVGGFNTTLYYWSSTEYDNGYSWYEYFGNGYQHDQYKFTTYGVRVIRAF